MGKHRFKLSDMMPNAWFYKLKDMGRSRKMNASQAMKNKPGSPTTSHRSHPSSSSYFPTEPTRAGSGSGNGKILYNSPIFTKASDFSLIDSPRRSSKRKARRKAIYYKPSSPTLVSSSVSVTTSSCHSTNNWTQQNQTQSPDYYASSVDTSSESHEYVSSESECDDNSVAAPDLFNGLPSNCSCRVSSSTNDIIIDMNNEVGFGFTENSEKLDGFEPVSEVDLPPILTKPLKFDKPQESSKTQRERRSSPVARKSSASSTGIRLRVNSPKLASKKVQGFARRKASRNTGFPEGFAVVKSSFDPETDFRDSMVEMIMENNIRASKDLEDLLACYLSLNSSEYHEHIVKAFEQIWIDMAQLRL